MTNPPRGEVRGEDGAPVRAIGDGWIKIYRKSEGYGELAVVIEHDLGRSYAFPNYYGTSVSTSRIISIYGHLRACAGRNKTPPCTDIPYVNDYNATHVWVTEGTIIGYVNNHPNNGAGYEHLHLGIRLTGAAVAASRDPTGWFRGYIWSLDESGNVIRCPNNCENDFAAASDVLRILGATSLISDANNDVYLLQGERIYHVLSAGVLEAMKSAGAPGWDWPSGAPVDIGGYEIGPGFIDDQTISDGLLVRPIGANEVYVLQNGRKRWLRSIEAVNWIYGDTWMRDDVIDVPRAVMDSVLPSQEGRQIWGVGEGESNHSVKNQFIAAYKTNASSCGPSGSWKGWPRQFSSCLEFPITRVEAAYASGASGIAGKYQKFGSENLGDIGEKGTINYSSKGTFAVHGAIYQRYKAMNFSRSALGFPIANEDQVGARRRSRFEGGSIYWDPATKQTTVEFNSTPTHTLSVSRSGTGTVSSGPNGISCGNDCSHSYPDGTAVVLTATPGSGWTFEGWRGACSGSMSSCTVTMTAAKSVSATFNAPVTHTLSVSKSGNGAVTSNPQGINCGSDCSENYPDGDTVFLIATPASGATFAGWSGACSGSDSVCSVTMVAARSVIATFDNATGAPTIRITSPGNGETWNPGTIRMIRWTSSGLDPSGVLKVYYMDHDNAAWRFLANLPPSATSYDWTVPMTPMRKTLIFVGNAVNGSWEEGWDLARFAISSANVPLYRVTVQNLTRGQPLMSPLVATHTRRVRAFRVNREASTGLQGLAENGNYTPLSKTLAGDTNVFDFAANTTGPLVPGSDPAGTGRRSAASVVLTAPGRRSFLSMTSKLICTNDGFTGISRVRLPKKGASVLLTKSYDAGTELATERFNDLVPDCQRLMGVSSLDPGTWVTNPGLAEGGTVRLHPGVYGAADLLPELHGWNDPVARVTVTRLGSPDATRFVARLTGSSQLARDAGGNHTLVDSRARGIATFRLDENDAELRVVLKVRRAKNVTGAHLHLGFPDQPGSIVATLFDPPVPVGSGKLAVMTLTESDLTGPLSGDFPELVQALRNGEIYVDVHSLQRPAGEIRGQAGMK